MIAPIFLSHGAPTLAVEEGPARRFLEGLGATMARPKAILAVSAHWETAVPSVNAVAANDTIHDFFGFGPELAALNYPAPGSPLLAGRVADLLETGGFEARVDEARGLDHGAWVPLLLAWPDADVPVVQLSVQPDAGPAHHLAVGRALAPLAGEDVLVLGSGSFTHDLANWRRAGPDEPPYVAEFAAWMDAGIAAGDEAALLDYRGRAPSAMRNHPTEEHILPLFVALGAAGEGAKATRVHSSLTHGVLRMDAYRFDAVE